MTAPLHPLQPQRLQALYAYEILETEREKDFDDIVGLAAAICGTAISVVNLVDADRQWFKAETGLGIRETPLTTSLCAHAILEDEFVEIHDTLRDPRMADNPLCTGEPGLRFYAGALLTTADGLPIGTLCVLDYQPRSLTALQRDTLRVLARQVMTLLELRKALETATMLRHEVDHRVKNSLQSLSSLARIESRHLKSAEAITAMENMTARLEAVSTLHELLYETDAGAEIGLADYVTRIGDHLGRLAPSNVRIEVVTEPLKVSSSEAVSVGTLVNELATNAFKHAFPDGRDGRLQITVRHLPDGDIQVTCRDDGTGCARKIAPRDGGLGMKIAEVSCMELGCELQFEDGAPGISASFRFTPMKRK